jgi:branched-chain amino acid transport system substrate-binding protein
MRLTATALAAALLCAAAVTSQPTTAQTTSAPTTPPKAAPTGPVKIGAILDMASLYADVTGPGTEYAIRTAVADYGGKVLGRPVEVLIADHQTKADIAASIATKWFDTEGVVALMDVAASSPALAVMNVANQRHRPVLLNGPGAVSITNESCNPYTVHYTYDTYANAHAVTKAVVGQGGKTWYYLTADYTFGHQLEKDSAAEVVADGGKVLGESRAPMETADFSSFLLAAQSSGAQVIGLANAGTDLINTVKQAAEFGMTKSGAKLASLGANVNDIHGIGLQATQGMVLADTFYWDLDDGTRAFAKRFFDKLHKMPNGLQAGAYSATTHYLQAVDAAGTTDGDAVMAKMKEMPIHDFFAKNGVIRPDGRMVHDMYLFQVKTPAESKGEWDLYNLVATIPGDQAFQPLSKSRCPMIKN